ncbi:MAG: hypothetical protein ABSG81_13065 [Acidimicrobiales bacterium]|jgi:hypothetical protein
MTAVFLARGFVNVTPDCVHGHLDHPGQLMLFGNDCVRPPGYVPWMVAFGIVGATAGVLLAVGALHLVGRLRARYGPTRFVTA